MKIMDLSGDDGECQIDTVISSKAKKTTKERLPFQTLRTDSPVANKKRKSHASPDVRNAKQPKVTTKENSFKESKKTEINTIIDNEDEVVEEINENKKSEIDKSTDNLKQDKAKETPDSKNKKSTPGKGSSTKTKKAESKVQLNTLTKFFKKIDNNDNKEIKSKSETVISKNKEESEKKSDVNKKLDESSKKSSKGVDVIDILTESDDENTPQNEEPNKNIKNSNEIEINDVESKKENKSKSEECNGTESKDSFSSNDCKESNADISLLNESEKMDADSSDILLSDDSEDEDDNVDFSKSDDDDTDNKKTEHEDTDSKDDTNRGSKVQVLTPTRSKLLNSGTREKKLTPKQIERKLEIQKKREMRDKQRLEREKKLQEERESRKKEKEEKKREREEKEKALKEQKRKEKELKELKRQADIEQKQKEKEAKEEDRRKREEAKEEEKKRKEEERLEAERKKQKAASNFVSFFVAKKPTDAKPAEEESKVEETGNFMPFEIKADMRVAPATRRTFTESEKSNLDKLLSSNVDKSKLYINEVKSKDYSIRKSKKTWPFEANDDVVIIDEEESSNIVQINNTVREKHRAKLLLFHENRRPPYWGTWCKKSNAINPRKPLAKDAKWFDYEVDSDDEWEEEEPGESLHGSDDEKEKDEDNAEENEYDVDNDFMVPHGYLSEEEIGADEEDDEDELNPENQKKKLKILGEQFEAERKTKTQKLKPKVIGCVWLTGNNVYPENLPARTVQYLTARHAWVREIPLTLTAPADADNGNDNENGTPFGKHGVASSARKAKALEEATPDLIRLLHGNTHGRGFLIKEFSEFLSKKREGEKPIPKAKLQQRIKEIATWTGCPEPGPMQDKSCWIVAEEYRVKYLGAEKLPLPNQWSYSLTPKKKSVVAETPDRGSEKEKEKEKEKKTVPLITQFTKTLTAEEMQKQLTEKPPMTGTKVAEKAASSNTPKPTPPTNKPPKRASLISVPRGEPFPKSPRVSLIDKFVTKDASGNDGKKTEILKNEDLDNDDCMIIDDSDEKVDVTSVSFEDKEVDNSKNASESKNKNADINMKSDQDKSANVSNNSEIEIVDV